MDIKNISLQTLRRLPVYLHYLKLIKDESASISATAIAERFGLNDVQVRKDLAAVSGSGRPKTGYPTDKLIAQIEEYLGCNSDTKSVLVGAGNLGKALLHYGGFADYGINIVAAFDSDESLVGSTVNGKTLYPVEDMAAICERERIKLGIITVPAHAAQSVCDELVSYGIRAIWNFAPTILRVPDGVIVENENLASSLAVLSGHLNNNFDTEV